MICLYTTQQRKAALMSSAFYDANALFCYFLLSSLSLSIHSHIHINFCFVVYIIYLCIIHVLYVNTQCVRTCIHGSRFSIQPRDWLHMHTKSSFIYWSFFTVDILIRVCNTLIKRFSTSSSLYRLHYNLNASELANFLSFLPPYLPLGKWTEICVCVLCIYMVIHVCLLQRARGKKWFVLTTFANFHFTLLCADEGCQ